MRLCRRSEPEGLHNPLLSDGGGGGEDLGYSPVLLEKRRMLKAIVEVVYVTVNLAETECNYAFPGLVWPQSGRKLSS
jgi:hypothetical protein